VNQLYIGSKGTTCIEDKLNLKYNNSNYATTVQWNKHYTLNSLSVIWPIKLLLSKHQSSYDFQIFSYDRNSCVIAITKYSKVHIHFEKAWFNWSDHCSWIYKMSIVLTQTVYFQLQILKVFKYFFLLLYVIFQRLLYLSH